MEDKAKLAKAQMDRRLEKKKAKADHRAAASQRDADSSQSDRSSSHAQASTSSPDSEMTFAKEPKKSRVRRGSTSIASTSAAGGKRKVKATAKAEAEPALPTKAQKRASTRSSRTSAWGKTDRAADTAKGNGVVRARQTSSSSSEQGYGTAVGGLFKVGLGVQLFGHLSVEAIAGNLACPIAAEITLWCHRLTQVSSLCCVACMLQVCYHVSVGCTLQLWQCCR